ncbi:MAG: hypothetical protein M1453_13860 [Acidobacteria bacterium]|nr:hypothetical protein [Acidobacteriota bacterium]MCL5289065.1 hypothetical protein [Acidobacteriota bacterium]
MRRALAVVLSIFFAASLVSAQEKPAAPPPAQAPAPPAAKAEDVASPDAIIAALYDVISGPVGQKRDWDRFRSLFAPGARLIPTGRNPQTGEFRAVTLDPEGYITRSSAFLERDGFSEKEIARRSERFGNIVHAFSTYEGRRAADPAPFVRGINSIQLFSDGTRWWIVTVFWQAESPETPLPKEFLPAK